MYTNTPPVSGGASSGREQGTHHSDLTPLTNHHQISVAQLVKISFLLLSRCHAGLQRVTQSSGTQALSIWSRVSQLQHFYTLEPNHSSL